MKFREWLVLRETMTSTADVAGFKRVTIPLVRRQYPAELANVGFKTVGDPFFKDKKKDDKRS